jgi:predicted TPR repeat methyltransferase
MAGAASPDPDLLARWAVALAESGFPDLAAATTARHAAAAGAAARAAHALAAAYFAAGTVHESRGNRDAARRAYERCLALSPEHAAAGERLAKLAGSW